MFVAAYDGGSGGGGPSNSLLCWFEKVKKPFVVVHAEQGENHTRVNFMQAR